MPTGKNLAAEVMNYMAYDAGAMGNHDLETGHRVYDNWVADCRFPVLGANIIDKATGKSYLTPYVVLEREGVKVAVLGMTTPAVPNWLPPSLWSGLEFQDLVACARQWVPVIREREKPDVLVGLFHSGKEGGIVTPAYAEKCSAGRGPRGGRLRRGLLRARPYAQLRDSGGAVGEARRLLRAVEHGRGRGRD